MDIHDGAFQAYPDHPNAFNIYSPEAAVIARSFKSKDFTAFQIVGDVVYNFLRANDRGFVSAKREMGIVYSSIKTIIYR